MRKLLLALCLWAVGRECATVQVKRATASRVVEELQSAKILAYPIPSHILGPLLAFDERSRALSFQCSPLFQQLQQEQRVAPIWPPPRYPSFDSMGAFTMDHAVPYRTSYFVDQAANGRAGPTWTKEYFHSLGQEADHCGTVGVVTNCSHLLRSYADRLAGKIGMVFSRDKAPWAEASLLAAGAKHVIAVRNATVANEHEQVTAMTSHELGISFSAPSSMDFVFSFGSVHREGMGRYGDPVRSSADLESVARAYCLLKDDGLLFLAVPVGPDAVVWNAHRIYGKQRLPLLLSNWEIIDVVGLLWGLDDVSARFYSLNQPVWVLKKKALKRADELRIEVLGP